MSVKGHEGEDREEIAELEDVESLKEALAEEKTRAEGFMANWQRIQADFINFC